MSQKSLSLQRGVLLMIGAAALFAATWIGCGALQNGSAFLVFLAVVLLWFLGAALILPVFQNRSHAICAAAGLYLCLCLRLCLFDYISPDYVSFLGPWTQTMRSMTIGQALRTPIGDYNMPYLYLLLIISRLPFYDLYCIKLVSVLSDVLLAVGMARLVRMLNRQEELALIAFFAVLLAPTVFLNSAYWGQCDGIYTCFGIWGLYFGLKRRPIASLALLACAFSFKLQTIFLLPIILFFLVREMVSLKQLLAFPAVFILIMLPALLAGRSLSDTFSIYLDQTNAYPYLSLNAPSFWSLIPNDYFSALQHVSVLLAGIVTVLLLYALLRRSHLMADRDLVAVALIFCLGIPWLLPRMHERYFYLAEILSIAYVAQSPRQLHTAVILLGGGFLIYSPYLFGQMPILTNAWVAVIYGGLLAYLCIKLLRTLEGRRAKQTDQKKEDSSHE